MKTYCPPARARCVQSGAALVTVLVLLLVMTLLGLVSVRTTLLEERMSGNLYDRSIGFQAAEAALRQAENRAAGTLLLPTSGCDVGICAAPVVGATPVWEVPAVWGAAPYATVDLEGDGQISIAPPQYIIELIADGVPPRGACTTSGDVSETECSGTERRYRITARSQDTGRAAVLLQSIFAVP